MLEFNLECYLMRILDCFVFTLQLKESTCHNSHPCPSAQCDSVGSRGFPWPLLGAKGSQACQQSLKWEVEGRSCALVTVSRFQPDLFCKNLFFLLDICCSLVGFHFISFLLLLEWKLCWRKLDPFSVSQVLSEFIA